MLQAQWDLNGKPRIPETGSGEWGGHLGDSGPRPLGADNYSRSDCVEKPGGWRSAWPCSFPCVDVPNVFGTYVSHGSKVSSLGGLNTLIRPVPKRGSVWSPFSRWKLLCPHTLRFCLAQAHWGHTPGTKRLQDGWLSYHLWKVKSLRSNKTDKCTPWLNGTLIIWNRSQLLQGLVHLSPKEKDPRFGARIKVTRALKKLVKKTWPRTRQHLCRYQSPCEILLVNTFSTEWWLFYYSSVLDQHFQGSHERGVFEWVATIYTTHISDLNALFHHNEFLFWERTQVCYAFATFRQG